MPDANAPALVRAVTYYRHSAQDRQDNSIPIQQDQVQAWAKEHGVEIIREFCDAGRSGLNSEGRPAFTDMMEEWISKRPCVLGKRPCVPSTFRSTTSMKLVGCSNCPATRRSVVPVQRICGALNGITGIDCVRARWTLGNSKCTTTKPFAAVMENDC